MAQNVTVSFRMDESLKRHIEEICQQMGLNLTTLLTLFCKKVEQERRIPFEVRADPFENEENQRYLKERLEALKAGTLPLEEHGLLDPDTGREIPIA